MRAKAALGGAVIDDATGKPHYTPVIEFEGRDTRDAFWTRGIESLLGAYPRAFDYGSAP
jgi:hypothetical protein